MNERKLFESESLIARNFSSSLPAFLNVFLKDRKLTKSEAVSVPSLADPVFQAAGSPFYSFLIFPVFLNRRL